MWFLLFVMSVAINCTLTIYFACYCIAIDGFDMLYVLGLLEALVFCGLGWILTCTSVSITTRSQPFATSDLKLVCSQSVSDCM